MLYDTLPMDKQFSEEVHKKVQPQDTTVRPKKRQGRKQLRPQSAPLVRQSSSLSFSGLCPRPDLSVSSLRHGTSVRSPSLVPFTSSSRDTRPAGQFYENTLVCHNVAQIHCQAEQALRGFSRRGIFDEESTQLILRIEVCRETRPTTSLRGSSLKYQQLTESITDAFLSSTLGRDDCFRVGEAHRSIPVGPVLKVESHAGRPGAFEVSLAVARPTAPLEEILIYSKLASNRFPNVSSLMNFLSATLHRGGRRTDTTEQTATSTLHWHDSSSPVPLHQQRETEQAARSLQACCRRGILQHTRWGLAQLMVNAECRFWQQDLARKRVRYQEILAQVREDLEGTRQLLQESGQRENESRLREKACREREVASGQAYLWMRGQVEQLEGIEESMMVQAKRLRRVEDDFIASQRRNEMLSLTIQSLEEELERTYSALDTLQLTRAQAEQTPCRASADTVPTNSLSSPQMTTTTCSDTPAGNTADALRSSATTVEALRLTLEASTAAVAQVCSSQYRPILPYKWVHTSGMLIST